MPPLTQNIAGLRAHACLAAAFLGSPGATAAQKRWASWLLHCLAKAGRHYDTARALTLPESREPSVTHPGSQPLPMLDYSFEIEDCITSLDKGVSCIQLLSKRGEFPTSRVAAMEQESRLLRLMRNKQEHMHTQLAGGQTTNGPILAFPDADNMGIRLQQLSLPFSALFALIDALYHDVADLYPGHDPASPPQPAGILRLSCAATISSIERKPVNN